MQLFSETGSVEGMEGGVKLYISWVCVPTDSLLHADISSQTERRLPQPQHFRPCSAKGIFLTILQGAFVDMPLQCVGVTDSWLAFLHTEPDWNGDSALKIGASFNCALFRGVLSVSSDCSPEDTPLPCKLYKHNCLVIAVDAEEEWFAPRHGVHTRRFIRGGGGYSV